MRLLFVAIIVLGVILAYGTPYPWLFWIALVNMILYFIISLTIPKMIASSAMKRHRAKVKDSYQRGTTDEDIDLILIEEVTITDSDKQAVPVSFSCWSNKHSDLFYNFNF